MMAIPWEEQLSILQLINGSLRGEEGVEHKQKWGDTWSTGMHSSALCCPCSPLPWPKPLTLSSSAQHQTRAFANKKGCSGSLECPTAALQSSSGGHLLSRWPMKRFMFSFTPALIFLGRGSLPGRSCINLRKRYPEVWHLINTLLYSIRSFALLSRTSPCQPCCAEIYCFKTKE